MKWARLTFAQRRIDVQLASRRTMPLTDEQRRILREIRGTCTFPSPTGDFNLLYSLGRDGVREDEIVGYVTDNQLIDQDGPMGGCGAYPKAHPSFVVWTGAGPITLAHELGHVLLGPDFRPSHSGVLLNLMYAQAPLSWRGPPPFLDDRQADAMRRSKFCRPR